MTVTDVIRGVTRLGVDTSPFIYFVEARLGYVAKCRVVFEEADAGRLRLITSMLTLTETLVHPLRQADTALENQYRILLLETKQVSSVSIDEVCARRAADLRARYQLRTPDAIQIAAALNNGCQAFLTNDRGLLRVTDLKVFVLDDLDL